MLPSTRWRLEHLETGAERRRADVDNPESKIANVGLILKHLKLERCDKPATKGLCKTKGAK